MAKISGSDIRPGMVIEHDGSLWAAVKTVAVKPGKGPAYNQVELKNILDGRKLNQRFGSSDRVEETEVERRQFQFLYKQGEQLVFMDTATYDQIELREDFVGERATFLQDGMNVQVQLHQDKPIGIKLPETVVLEVVGSRRPHQGTDRRLVLQVGEAGKRAPRPGAAVHRHGREGRGLDRRGRLRPAGGVMLPLRADQRDGLLRAQGRALAQARLRRGRESSGFAERSGQLRHRRRPARRGDASRRTRQGAARLRLPRRGKRQARGQRRDATPGSSIRSTAPPISCTASRSSRSRSAWSAPARSSRASIYNPDHRRDVHRRARQGRVPERPADAGCGAKDCSPMRWSPAACRIAAAATSSWGLRSLRRFRTRSRASALRRRRPRPRLCRRGTARRLLGAEHLAVGYRGGHHR